MHCSSSLSYIWWHSMITNGSIPHRTTLVMTTSTDLCIRDPLGTRVTGRPRINIPTEEHQIHSAPKSLRVNRYELTSGLPLTLQSKSTPQDRTDFRTVRPGRHRGPVDPVTAFSKVTIRTGLVATPLPATLNSPTGTLANKTHTVAPRWENTNDCT